ncbi:MAG: SDR family oxidoreductase [Gammaproteobacteria bacterium]|nr:SDR family oxidoreductase [Gammaproteobacteria bacterium]
MATEHGGRGIRANTIAPGPMDTPVRAPAGHFDDGALYRRSRKGVSAPQDIARAAVFLASDAAEFINGAAVPVDGAVHARLASPQID